MMARQGDSEYSRVMAPPSANVSRDVLEFIDLSPRKQQEVSQREWKAYGQKMAEKHPRYAPPAGLRHAFGR